MARAEPNGITLVIDLDGTIADFVGAVLTWFQRPIVPSLLKQWDTPLLAHYEEAVLRPEFHSILLPYLHARAAVGGMYDSGYKIKIATNRPPGTEHLVVNWLTHWNIPFDELLLGENKNLAGKHIIIDDKPHNIRVYTDKVGPGILVRQPWNRHILMPRHLYPIAYGDSWDDIVQKVRILVNVEGRWGRR